MLFGLDERPPVFTAILAGLQHVLAVFGGILAAPLIIAVAMGLSVRDTSYLVSSALVISGVATILQIQRIGPVGSGLLSIQGTSFSFIGSMIAVFFMLGGDADAHRALGILFGSSAVCAVMIMGLSFALPQLRHVVTPNVTGATVILIGLTLVWTTLNNIQRAYLGAEPGMGWQVLLLSGLVFCTIIAVTRLGNPWFKLVSITIGLLVGYIAALLLNLIDFSKLEELDVLFVPQPARYPLAVHWGVVAMLSPIFVISMMESVGDLTATSSLSGLSTSGRDYWQRIRGGVLGDSVNSLMASLFCSFPNTTFSQNNGVIQLTGVCSRYVGFYVAGFLVLLGTFPIVGGLFQVMPDAVLHGATLLMFAMVGYSGFRIVVAGSPGTYDWLLVAVAVAGGWTISQFAAELTLLPPAVITVIEFPVSTGALVALCFELVRFILRHLGGDDQAGD